ncbi:ParB/RepB/Spo0J family partition protein [Cohnella sp.]|uniref:ParB/RepB/Spo0J family partition protein n=1 Tax=Cohnella sp. TaxID=1883426 RepID=UPI003567704E
MDIIEIQTHLIDEDTDQPRYQFGEESLQELIESISELGLLSPIKVRTANGGRYKIIYGNRRYKACKTLGRPTIPCIVSTVTDEMEIYLEQIAENLTREGFSPIEEAEAFNKLLTDPKFSSSTKYLSSKLGKPESYIKNKCELLKFSNAVKKLIVSGTDIRKDKLTEDQLLPLKDLPMEHRDSLALIMARDEMPVSDVKRIARLFKDSGISDGTKSKLLYKSGHELLETWSVFEHNKKERAKAAAEPKQAVKKDKPEKSSDVEENSISEPVLEPSAGSNENLGTIETIQSKLLRILEALPAHQPLSPEALQSVGSLPLADKDQLLNGIDTLIDDLEKHLADWRAVKGLANN